MGPFASNSITKHKYIGRRTVQPSNWVYRPPHWVIPVWGVCPLDWRGVVSGVARGFEVGVWGGALGQRGPGAEPLVRGSF